MKTILSSRIHHDVARVSIFLITVALALVMVGCGCGGGGGGSIEYDLTIASTEGGEVTEPGEETFTYREGKVVDLVAEAEEGYYFVKWTGDVDDIANIKDATTTITMNDDYSITANFVAIYDLTINSTAGGLVTTPGEGTFTYDEGTVVNLVAVAEEGYEFARWTGDVGSIADVNAASTTVTVTGNYNITADFGIEIWDWYDLDAIRDNLGGSGVLMNDLDPTTAGYIELAGPAANEGKGWAPIGAFTGSFDGQGYEIMGLFVNRPDDWDVGLFGWVVEGGVIENVGVVNADITGDERVGGLVGYNWGTVSNSYATASVTGNQYVGCLVGSNGGTVSNSYATGSVTGEDSVGGLLGMNSDTVSNSYYSHNEVLINGKNVITTGALFGEDFEQWLANDKFLGVNERLSQENGYYVVSNVSDFKELLAFGQDGSLKFRLKDDLDLATEPDFYIPYLAGEFDGHGHKITNLNFDFDFVSQVGLFGYLASGGEVTQVDAEKVNITGASNVGGLVGTNDGTVSDSYATGSVTGHLSAGGLVGLGRGIVSNSHYDYDEVLINGQNIITVGALYNEDFEQWLVNDKLLDVNERLSQEDGYYVVSNVSDFKELLAFGQDDSLKFRLKSDLDLAAEPNFYIPYLAGEFDGHGHKILNLSFNFDFVSQVGLFGYLASGGSVTGVGVENVNITGASNVGGLGGTNEGTVSNSSVAGDVTGDEHVGCLVGSNRGTVSNSYATGRVTGKWDVGGLVGKNYDEGTLSNSSAAGDVTGDSWVGGLAGENYGTVGDCSATGSVTGDKYVGGLVGLNYHGNVSDSSASSSVTGSEAYVGGLVGLHYYGTVGESYANGSVTGGSQAGGLVGINMGGTVSDCSATGGVTGDDLVGGLVGYSDAEGTVNKSSATGDVTGKEVVGGLVGENDGTVSDCYAAGSVSGGELHVGGLVGLNYYGTVGESYATSSVTGGDQAGGLLGTNVGGTVSNSYSSANVKGDSWVGGLVGVNGWGSDVSNSYSTGTVTGYSSVGGLVGVNDDSTVSNSFWDTQTSGQATSAAGTGKTTAEMHDIATFSGAGWNIIAVTSPSTRNPVYIWNIVNGQTYPFLSWEPV